MRRHQGGRNLALVVQGWHRGRSDLTMDAMVAVKHVQNSRTKVVKEVGCTHVAQRRQEDGTHIASPVPPLCLLWPTNSVHWAITVVTTVPLFGDYGNRWATMAMVLPPLCLLCTTCCATTAVFGDSRKAQVSCCSSYTKIIIFWVGQSVSILINFVVAQRWHEGCSPV